MRGASDRAGARRFEEIPKARGGLPLLGHWPEVVRDPFGFLERGAARGPIVRYRFGPWHAVLLHDPTAIQHVLQQSPRLYRKSRNYAGMKVVLGSGLLTSEGDFWRRQRKLAQPAFHHAKLKALVATMASATRDMLDRWKLTNDATSFDLHAEMMRVTLRIAGLTLFGVDLDGDASDIRDAVAIVLPWVNGVVEQPFRPPLWVPTRENRRVTRAMRRMDELVFRIVAERRRRDPENERADLLSMLMSARDDEGAAMSDRQLRDEVLTLVMAGHETTANALSWTWMHLARHPSWRAAVEREAREVLGERTPSFEDLAKLEVCGRVVDEAMRLHPPAWEYEREPIEDDVVLGYAIPKGTIVMIPPFTMHRHADYWEEPLRFDPDRWLPERAASRPRYAYIPFGDGPRVCIGKSFALIEAKLLLAMMAREARIELAPGARIELEPSITLRPRGGMPMRRRAIGGVDPSREARA